MFKEKIAISILNAFGADKGIAIKAMQIMGSSEESLDFYKRVAESNKFDPIPLNNVRKVVDESDPDLINKNFIQIEEADWVASLGQVHKCRLKDYSDDYVIKILFPDVRKKVEKQLKALGMFASVGAATKLKKWNFDIEDYKRSFKEALDKEMNYKLEASNLLKFHKLNEKRNLLYPRVVQDLSGDNFITMSRVEGEKITDFEKNGSWENKRDFSKVLLNSYLRQLLDDGFVQGDTHKGNYYVSEARPVFLDFGHYLELNENERRALVALLKMAMKNDYVNPQQHLEVLGFDLDKISLIEEKVPHLLNAIFFGFTQNRPLDLSHWTPGKDVNQVLGEQKWWFRSAGSGKFFQLIRSFHGIYNIIKGLDVKLNWYQHLINVIGYVKLDTVSSIKNEIFSNPREAKHLKIIFYRDGKKKVDLAMPARAVKNLEELVSEDLLETILEQGHDLSKIKEKAMASGLSPGPLFELEDQNRTIKVYLD